MLISDMIQKIADSHFDNKKELIEMLTILADGRLDVNIDHLKNAQVNLIFDLLCTGRYDREIKLMGRDLFKHVDCLNHHSFDGPHLVLTVDVWDYYLDHATTQEAPILVPSRWMELPFDLLVVEIQEWLDEQNKQQRIASLIEQRQLLVRQMASAQLANEKRLLGLSAIDAQLDELEQK